MRRITNIFQNRPQMLCQTQDHRRTTSIQRTMSPRPIIQVPPQPQTPLQHTRQLREIPSPPSQPALLRSQRAVQSLQMRSIDPPTNSQLPDSPVYVLQTAKQGISAHLQQIASGIPQLLDYAHQQPRRGLECGLALATSSFAVTPAMLDDPEDPKYGRRIRQMVVYQQQRQVRLHRIRQSHSTRLETGRNSWAAQSHRGHQLAGHIQGSWPNTKVYHKTTDNIQCHVNPRTALWTSRASAGSFASRPFFGPSDGDLATRACNSSNWTASGVFSSRSSCSRWKSCARLPAFSSNRSTVRGSTSQISAVASTEQPCPRHLIMRTTVGSPSLAYRMSEPSRSLNRVPQVLQYSRRMALFLPIRSAMDRLPVAKWLKSAQSGFGQAKKDKGYSVKLWVSCWWIFLLAMSSFLAEDCHLSNNSSAKMAFLA